MAEALPKNFIDYEEYPQTADIQNKCVNMIARLYNAPTDADEDNAMVLYRCPLFLQTLIGDR